MSITSRNELELQQKICTKLNTFGHHFETTGGGAFCDIIDPTARIYVEVKRGPRLAAGQLLYGIVKEEISDATLLGVANEREIRFYTPPQFAVMSAWAHRISPNMSLPPSSIGSTKDASAFDLLGDPVSIYNYIGDLDLRNGYAYIVPENYALFKDLFDRYWIEPVSFVRFVSNVTISGADIHINGLGEIMNDRTGVKFVNIGVDYEYKMVRLAQDRQLIKRTRVNPVDLPAIAERIDEMSPMVQRRQRGKFFTSDTLAEEACGLIAQMLPEYTDFILEPYVGSGNMIRPLFEGGSQFVINDIDAATINITRARWQRGQNGEDYSDRIHNVDFITTPTDEILEWIPEEVEHLLIFTNPPYGTASTNALASNKRDALKATGKRSRGSSINYGDLGDQYGRGDLLLPAIGKMIEVIKARGEGILAFFCPFGVMCGRPRYNKLLAALFDNFEFIYGSIHSGAEFGDVAKGKPIAFSIWKYAPGEHSFSDMRFDYRGQRYEFRSLPLLKNVWRYNTSEAGERLSVLRCDTFNAPVPKMFSPYATKGGSHVIPENVRSGPAEILGAPAELIYALWSSTVGMKGLIDTRRPESLHFGECCTHLPDFGHPSTPGLLGTVALMTIVREKAFNYTNGMISYDLSTGTIVFGNPRLAAGVRVLLSHVPTEWFERLRESEQAGDYTQLMTDLRRKIDELTNEIGYWDYLPFGLEEEESSA